MCNRANNVSSKARSLMSTPDHRRCKARHPNETSRKISAVAKAGRKPARGEEQAVETAPFAVPSQQQLTCSEKVSMTHWGLSHSLTAGLRRVPERPEWPEGRNHLFSCLGLAQHFSEPLRLWWETEAFLSS